MNSERSERKHLHVPLAVYDAVVFLACFLFLFVLYKGSEKISPVNLLCQGAVSAVCIFVFRIIFGIYRQIWRYGGIQCYIRLLIADGLSTIVYYALERLLPITHITYAMLLAFCCMDCLGALAIRMIYRYAYKCGRRDDRVGRFLRGLLKVFSGGRVTTDPSPDSRKIEVAIIGAGIVGVELAEDLISNPKSNYAPHCFIDVDKSKAGRTVHDIQVLPADEATLNRLREMHIKEVIFAISNLEQSRKVELYDFYKKAGFKVKVYDYPSMETVGKRRQLREFDIEDLLFRKPIEIVDEKTYTYYRDKVILITGGGGSIGSEITRQLAKMVPKQLIIADIYENCAYDLQQDMKITYHGALDVRVEIISIANKRGLARIFEKYHPQIVINAAAHKHVPLMEYSCIEAIENNVFGTENVIELCEEYGTERFMMVSTDKAVNPTNVMGATKRMCEMIMQAHSTKGIVKCSATRFGNVLGSAGSVIPLFKKQIAAGGPVTLTDNRIIRYFMTIPEASQLVLQSGAMAQNGELFVLDMGKPVRIRDLAENMIELSGAENIEIVETGLRPGEKLYEELLVKTEELDKTDNELIFIERDNPITMEQLDEKLAVLKQACETDDNEKAREALRVAVPTYKRPEEVNKIVDEQK